MADDVGRVTRSLRVASPGVPSAPAPAQPSQALPAVSYDQWGPRDGQGFRQLMRGTTIGEPLSLRMPTQTRPPRRFPFTYSVDEVLRDPARARAFVEDYFSSEAPFFRLARDERTGLAIDGVNLDPVTREPASQRSWTVPSKECLDLALLVKILERDPLALRLVPGDAQAEVLRLLERKITTYERFARDYPGYGGFMPWVVINADGSVAPSNEYWERHVPALDNGEWAFVLLGVEHALREQGHTALADRYRAFNQRLAGNVRRVFFDEEVNAVRDQTRVTNNRDPSVAYEGYPYGFIRAEHGVHEGAMMLHYMALHADPPLSRTQVDRMWAQTRMERLEHQDGTTWQGFWGSSHEEWEFAIMPKRDLPEYRDLFRIRQEIRTHDANRRGNPGFGASINSPIDGYAIDHGIPSIAREPVTSYPFYALYGVFPVLLEQSGRDGGREGLAWLLNGLRARNAVTSIGGGEAVTNDGTRSTPMKTVDGTFLNLLALTGGLEDTMRRTMQANGTYDRYQATLRGEYQEAFGTTPLREPSSMARPSVPVPWTDPE